MSKPLFLVLLTFLLVACGSDASNPTPQPTTCAYPLGSACAGVTSTTLCEEDACTAGATCKNILAANDDASLAGAAASAMSGACITLAPGTYKAITLPGGVSLLGKGVDHVVIGGVKLGAGKGSLLRGFTIEGGGVDAGGATNARVESVRVKDAPGDAVAATAGASLTLAHTEILGAKGYGVRAADPASLSLETTAIEGADKTGLFTSCGTGCDCKAAPPVSLATVVVRKAGYSGISLLGVAATITGAEVSETHGYKLQGGGGVAAWGCANVDASGLKVHDNLQWGVLFDEASGHLGLPGGLDEKGMIIYGNVLGLWVQNQKPGQMVEVNNADLHANLGAGIGSAGDTVGMIIYGTVIKDTGATKLPVAMGGSKEVGHGLVWGSKATLQIDGLSVSGSAHQAILIDGPVGAGSSLAHVTLADGDEKKGIVQQSFSGGASPMVGAGAPQVTESAGMVDAIPLGPATPASP